MGCGEDILHTSLYDMYEKWIFGCEQQHTENRHTRTRMIGSYKL